MSQIPFNPFGKTTPLRRYAPPPPASSIQWWVIPVLAAFLVLCSLGLLFSYILASAVSGAGSAIFGHINAQSGSPVSIPALGDKQPQSASTIANDFMRRLKDHNSLEAYNNFDTTVLVLLTPLDFERQATHADTYYGAITYYQIVASTEGQGEAPNQKEVLRSLLACTLVG